MLLADAPNHRFPLLDKVSTKLHLEKSICTVIKSRSKFSRSTSQTGQARFMARSGTVGQRGMKKKN